MQSAVALNVQQSIRPGECIDTFYAGKENSMKQCHATVEDNRFFQGLQSTQSGGSSTLTFNPNEGLGEVILTLQLPVPATTTGLSLPPGWGYSMIRRIGYRYGSSQLYYITGAQNLLQTVALCEDSGKRDAITGLGGAAVLSDSDWADAAKRTAYVYLRLPHSSPALSGGSLPFPTDILTAPVQIQVDLVDFTSVISQAGGGGVVPTQLSVGQANFTQVTMQDAGDLVARRFDMSKHALTIPLPESWTQEAVSFQCPTGGDGSFSLSLTGCKAGDLKKLRLWFVRPDLDDPAPPGLKNPNYWRAPLTLRFAINGLIYFDSNQSSYLLTQVLRRRVPPFWNAGYLTAGAAVAPGPYATATVAPSQFVEIDLAQPHTIGDTGEVALVHGVPVMNSVLSLSGTLPSASANWVCFVEYNLNCSWMASRGSAEFIF
jgi:hypothetical protein